jgi:hypothetical protein
MSLTTNKDDSMTLGERRHHVCLESAWELDALADLLPTVTTNGIPEATKTGYQVRAIAGRIKTLASILMSGLGDSLETTDDMERELKVTG